MDIENEPQMIICQNFSSPNNIGFLNNQTNNIDIFAKNNPIDKLINNVDNQINFSNDNQNSKYPSFILGEKMAW